MGPTLGATNATQLSVGVYLDQVFLLKPQGQLLDLAAIESVQVLRGPQGTLFGKNTTGELIPFDEEEIYSTEVG
ncbi:MAG: TonB-dependent receptor plug domain-containing protein, partial [Halioglobus sp.]